MSDLKASIILAENVTSTCIENVIKTMPSNKRNNIWIYLTLKANLNNGDEINIGFDIVKHDENDEEKKYGFELGGFDLVKINDEDEITEDFEARNRQSVSRYKDTFIVFKQLPPLPILDAGNHEFIVYEKENSKKRILDTFQFDVV